MKIGINALVSAVFPFYSCKKKAEMSGEYQRYFTWAPFLGEMWLDIVEKLFNPSSLIYTLRFVAGNVF
jgi:hypothetical protein